MIVDTYPQLRSRLQEVTASCSIAHVHCLGFRALHEVDNSWRLLFSSMFSQALDARLNPLDAISSLKQE
jgi:hypothetical protein